jgi:hypothetical protein
MTATADFYAIDFKGQTNLLAQRIPSAVGMVGFYIHALGGEFDLLASRFASMLSSNEARPVSFVGRRIDAQVAA